MLQAGPAQGVDVVYGIRTDRSTDSAFKRVTARAVLPADAARVGGTACRRDAGDFRLMSRATVDAVNALPEHHRVLRLVVPALGFPSAEVALPPRGARRRHARSTRSSRMIRLSSTASPASRSPRCGWPPGSACSAASPRSALLGYALVAFADRPHRRRAGRRPFVAVAAVGAVQLLCLGLLGEYVGRMYTQMQGRPSYFVAYDSLEHARHAGRTSRGRRGRTVRAGGP